MKTECDSFLSEFGSAIAEEKATIPPGSTGSCRSKNEKPGQLPTPSDSELVSRYLDKGSQDAFTTLVERYQVMVLGTAFRRTRNLELARDIAQEVFTTLVRKMPGLIGRASLGGWLHQATVYESARILQGEDRRLSRQARYAAEEPASVAPALTSDASSESAAILDEVLGLLSDSDREVLILHYFQDLSYAEMSAMLGTNEAAVRQRVCRALDRLSKRLRDRGISGAAVVLLLSAAGTQSAVAAPAGLAISAVAAASVGSTSSLSLVLSGLLSQTAIKGAAAAVVALTGVAIGWQVIEATDSYEKAAPLFAMTGDASKDGRPGAGRTDSGAGVFADRGASGTATTSGAIASSDTASATQQSVQQNGGIPNSVASARPMAFSSSASSADSKTAQTGASDPSKSASQSTDPRSTAEKSTNGNTETPKDVRGRFKEIAEAGGLPAVVDELNKVELVPSEAAEVYGEALTEALDLDPAKQLRLEEILQEHFEQLNSEGIAGLKPAEITKDAWQFARQEVIVSTAEKLTELLPIIPEAVPKLVSDVLSLPETLVEPVVESIVQPVVQPIVESVVEPVLEPIVESVVDPIVKPIANVVEQTVPPVVQAPLETVGTVVETVEDVLPKVVDILAPGVPLLPGLLGRN